MYTVAIKNTVTYDSFLLFFPQEHQDFPTEVTIFFSQAFSFPHPSCFLARLHDKFGGSGDTDSG